MKGYKRPVTFTMGEIVIEETLVGCRRCDNIWREPRSVLKYGPRINGPHYDYDYCDKCISKDEKTKLTKASKDGGE